MAIAGGTEILKPFNYLEEIRNVGPGSKNLASTWLGSVI